jgi:hypothetical protein
MQAKRKKKGEKKKKWKSDEDAKREFLLQLYSNKILC